MTTQSAPESVGRKLAADPEWIAYQEWRSGTAGVLPHVSELDVMAAFEVFRGGLTSNVLGERDWFRPEDAEYIESIRLIERDHIIRSLRAHKEQRSNGTMAAPAGWWTAAKFIEGLE